MNPWMYIQDSTHCYDYIVASELKDPICHSNECQIGSLSSVATILLQHYDSVISLLSDTHSGMSTMVVMPPAAAARVAEMKPSHSVRPGSFT